MTKIIKLESLLSNSKKFLKKIKTIKINKANIPILAQKLRDSNLVFQEAKKFLSLPPIFYLLVDGLNFCFWNINDKKRFSYKNKKGSVALALKIKENLKQATPEFLFANPDKFYKILLKNTSGQLLLSEERIKIIKEIGKFLKKYNLNDVLNKFKNKDINLAANFFALNLPYTFSDKTIKLGIELPFYKKLRLFLSDLIALGGINFKNKEKLLIFVDSALPALFLFEKILILDKKIEREILEGKIFKHNSLKEISWRAATVVCAFYLKKLLPQFSYQKLDRLLWLYAKKNLISQPKVLGRFY